MVSGASQANLPEDVGGNAGKPEIRPTVPDGDLAMERPSLRLRDLPPNNGADRDLTSDMDLALESPDVKSSQASQFSKQVEQRADVLEDIVSRQESHDATLLERSHSPSALQRDKPAACERVSEIGFHQLYKFSLYETRTRYFLVGGDLTDSHFRVLKIDRTAAPGELQIFEDEIVYAKREMNQLLNAIEDGNSAAGGMKLKTICYGVLGFIRFTDAYYMLVITKRQQVAMIGGHYIYRVEATDLVPLTTGSSSNFDRDRNANEVHFLSILGHLDLNKSFYFSYSYDITRTLQHNLTKARRNPPLYSNQANDHDFGSMFVWNQYLLGPALDALKNPYDWCIPIIHGFIDQSVISVFGRDVFVTLIARRSRFFAGARFLKRGVNDLGYVANDVETEQIVADMLITSFNAPGNRPLKNPNYTSYVQHRGSIPLYWTQDNAGVSPKPAISLNLTDPYHAATALHFNDLFERYGAPVAVLNLVKAKERTPRESILMSEYQHAINYLNQMLPKDKKIIYRAYDMARADKTGQDVIGSLEKIAVDLMSVTGIFHNGEGSAHGFRMQNGIIRSNCIDCLDRTNAAQFVVGKRALACQLQALGIVADAALNYDTDASNLHAHMFNDHGDTLASQYGGSQLVNTTDTYRKINNWQSQSRDMVENIKRYYHNSFFDSQRQEAYNLFLGNYVYAPGKELLWEMPNDYYLHHARPYDRYTTKRRSYVQWYSTAAIANRTLKPLAIETSKVAITASQDWWLEYYRPHILSTFPNTFSYKVASTSHYFPKARGSKFDLSPFSVRKESHDTEHADKKAALSGIASSDSHLQRTAASIPTTPSSKRVSSLQAWLNPSPGFEPLTPGADATRPAAEDALAQPFKPADKLLQHQWTLAQFHRQALHPTVSAYDRGEYARYLSHGAAPLASAGEYSAYLASPAALGKAHAPTRDGVAFEYYLAVKDEPLGVNEGDGDSKRYKAYRKWLKGKSLFKQSKVGSEAPDSKV